MYCSFLSGRGPNDSKTIIGFSTTSNPADPWNVYEIGGNPLNNNTWTDYPQVALTTNELFYTVNLLKSGQGWIEGFDRTIIWQIDKHSGFDGDDSLKLKPLGFNLLRKQAGTLFSTNKNWRRTSWTKYVLSFKQRCAR